ncbi:hypothetical protein NCCP1664_17210 [Zafaria cholistanensis]|uniref:Lipoprotein n=1 Tax=Zafaria cholistanensis TaxID=1682741 RepID=A0A5A7NR49_9MICC|nr:hypothetical protein [Zafaria cholistanensis]GER23225.1 hypothetical protein NCCP1664_17210 [Zafaria cholistanensis]
MRAARSLPLVLSMAAALALVAGCGSGADTAASSAASQLGGAAESAASGAKGAASSAASQAGDAARTQAIRAACAPVEDGEVSGPDRAVLTGLGAAAEQAGIPAEIAVPLKEIVAAGDQPPAEAVQRMRDACAAELAK